MVDRSRVRVSGPLASYVRGFGGELARLGYTPLSARLQLQLMAHLSRWLASEELARTGAGYGCFPDFAHFDTE